MTWTPEKEEKLKELWKKGLTASQISKELGDTSRNAVIGKAHRLNLEARAPSKKRSGPASVSTKSQAATAGRGRKSKFKSLLLDKNFEPENPKTLEELSDETCRWPIGHPDEANFYFCGRKPIKDFSYCKLHVLYAFQTKDQKEDLIDKEDEVPQFIQDKIKSA